jgi:tRNA(fMet)-specific endonuclease VapC
MTDYVLDTDTLTLFSHGQERVSTRVAVHRDVVSIAAVTAEESLKGWLSSIRAARRPSEIETAYQSFIQAVNLVASFPLLNYSQTAIARYETRKKLKLNVGGNDLRIAAIALEHNATVVSANLRDFTRVPDLKVEDWSQA